MKVGLFGFGRAGRAVASVVLNNEHHVLEWVVRQTKTLDHRSAPEYLGMRSSEPGLIYPLEDMNQVFSDPRLLVDGIIDFSAKESVFEYGEYARENGISVVTAISQYDDEQKDYLKDLGRDIRVLWSPNITIGINFLLIAARVLQKIAPSADIEILEEHFKQKPEVSGTARIIATALGLGQDEVKTIRAGGIIGRHEVLFGFPFQTVRLSHESISREAFGNGAIFALESIAGLPKGLYSMEDIIRPYFAI